MEVQGPPVHQEQIVESHSTLHATAHHGKQALKDITFGSIAGMVGKMVEYPFDTVKVRLQSQPDHLPLVYSGPLDCLQKSIRNDGVRGLFRGLSAPLVGAAAENASLFLSYDLAQKLLKATIFQGQQDQRLPLSALAIAGAMSGGVTSFILTPIELVKCRTQVPMQSPIDPTLGPKLGLSANAVSPASVIRDVWSRQGLSGFWRGQVGTLLRETGGSMAWFGSYELLTAFFTARAKTKQQSDSVQIPVWQQMSAGAVAGISYNFIFYPADTIKSKMQTGELGSGPTHQQSFLQVGRMLWKTHGLKGLYRGCGITVARAAPSSALIFTVYEHLKQRFPG